MEHPTTMLSSGAIPEAKISATNLSKNMDNDIKL